jgi:hypothetical protein
MHRFTPVLHVPGLVILVFCLTMPTSRRPGGLRPGAGNMPVMSKPLWRIV